MFGVGSDAYQRPKKPIRLEPGDDSFVFRIFRSVAGEAIRESLSNFPRLTTFVSRLRSEAEA
jgi:hypothetical protein